MTRDFTAHLSPLDTQRESLLALLIRLAEINSFTDNTTGVVAAASAIITAIQSRNIPSAVEILPLGPASTIDAAGRQVSRPIGPALRVIVRPDAPFRVLLCIHFDTVYPPDSPFQKTRLDGSHLYGPGVADAKGGLVVLLAAVDCFERSPWAKNLGYEILLNPDEEIGSPSSRPLLIDAARRNHLGLLYEPAREDGSFVSTRKGSGNFTIVVRGRSAHAGRDPHLGRNAIHALARILTVVPALAALSPGITVNVGAVSGGGPVNVVPDLAIARFNIRVETPAEQNLVEQSLAETIRLANQADGIKVELSGQFLSPPKVLDEATMHLKSMIDQCAAELAIPIGWKTSGGVCDGNKLAAAGLPNIDTLGVCGANLHSTDEYMLVDSLIDRAKLSALLLMKLASGKFAPPRKGGA